MNSSAPFDPTNPSATAARPPGDATRATATSAVKETVEKVRQATHNTAGKAKDKVAEMAGEGKTAAADRMTGYSDQLREAARSMESGQDPNIAHFATQAADRLEKVADYLRDADFSRLRDDAAQVARRHPALFMGGMLVAGLILGNVAKASFQSLSDADREGGEDDLGSGDGQERAGGENEPYEFEGTDDDRIAAGTGVEHRNSES